MKRILEESQLCADTAAVRTGEELNVVALAGYLRGKVTGIDSNFAVEQFPSGHSNLTYLLRTRASEYVLRRGPLGPVAPKAHDMAREFRLLEALHPHFPEAPKVVLLCEDSGVLGAPFFVMERRSGFVLRDRVPSELAAVPNYPHLTSAALVDCLVRLHAIDVAGTGLIKLGKPDGFLERQVRGWAERWNRAQTEELAEMGQVIRWLEDKLPESGPPTMVHNDYKLDNVMLRVSSGVQVEAVLDWEMATVGDPLADLGLTLCYWTWANAPDLRAAGIRAPTSQPGWYSRQQFVDRYAAGTGRDVSGVRYYEVLGIFKLAVILQQIYYRFQRGQTKDERFANFDKSVKGLTSLATSLLEAS